MRREVPSCSVLVLVVVGMVMLNGTLACAHPEREGSFVADVQQSDPYEESGSEVSDSWPSSGVVDNADADQTDAHFVEGIGNAGSSPEEQEGRAVDEGDVESVLAEIVLK